MNGGAIVVAVIAFPMALILGLVLAITSLAAPANACTPAAAGQIAVDAIPTDATVAGYGREQLANAAAIMNAASAIKLPVAAQSLGVQAAIGESSLVNLEYGDGAINPDGSVADSVGLFQQQSSWGTTAQRSDPTTAATLFFQRLVAVDGWDALDPSIAINNVQINADPFHYSKYRAAAVEITSYLAGLSPGAGTGGCQVSGDAAALAQGLVAAMDNGSLKLLEERYAAQIINMANGKATPDCQLDVRVLQLITLTLNHFQTVGVSDLNRKCAGTNLGTLAHWAGGGGNAVDFYQLNGSTLDGASTDNMALLDLVSTVAPAGTRAGQVNCRDGQQWQNISQIVDSCDHQHIDFLFADAPLNVVS